MQDSEVTINQNLAAPIIPKPADLPGRLPEVPSNAFIPMVFTGGEIHPVIRSMLEGEIQRASLTTLKMLGVDISKYQNGIKLSDILDTEAENNEGELTLPRKKGVDPKILAIIASPTPIYNKNGSELPAFFVEGENKFYINLHMLDQDPLGKVSFIACAGAFAVEETLHFVQTEFWKRSATTNVDVEEINEHMKDPLEAEALPYKQKILDLLYPQLKLKVVGLDDKPRVENKPVRNFTSLLGKVSKAG